MLAYHNDPKIKANLLAQLAAHRAADEIVRGHGYWTEGRGCAVGCTVHSGNHAEYEPRYGIPQIIAWLEDCIFEGLPIELAKEWPQRFSKAIVPGADLSLVGWKFLHWILTDKAVNPGIDHPIVRDAVRQCADVVAQFAKGIPVAASAAWSAESAASAAWSAESAEIAARSAESAEIAARSAASAESAAWSAESAAWSAASAEIAARSAESAESAEIAARSAESAAWSAEIAEIAEIAARSAASAAWSAESAASAARSAESAEIAARSAASAESAAWSAESAAWSAESAESAARSAAYILMADKLCELLNAA
jgi:hypothetical protein